MKLFGTDGIRGVANIYPIVPSVITKLAMAASHICKKFSYRPTVVIGKDTRISGYMIETALTTGFIAQGINVIGVGPLPTPGISMLTQSLRADLGIMISASHNPYQDNGIKFFGANGYKLSHDLEKDIENLVTNNNLEENAVTVENLGKATRLDGASERYIEYIKHVLPRKICFDGLKIVIDCAHGAAYNIAPKVLWELGAEIIPIGTQPDGFNINKDVGALHYSKVQQAVLNSKANIGIALDGDADRLVIIDEKGAVLNGDHIIAVITQEWQKHGRLTSDCIVGTVMSNLGLEQFLNKHNLQLKRSDVGDRNVNQLMQKYNSNIGGEQSGHVILSDFSCTGDGLLCALQMIAIMLNKNKPASQAFQTFKDFPQILANIQYSSKNPLDNVNIKEAIKYVEQKIDKNGRMVVRQSGTEPMIRIMIEGNYDQDILNGYIDIIKKEIK